MADAARGAGFLERADEGRVGQRIEGRCETLRQRLVREPLLWRIRSPEAHGQQFGKDLIEQRSQRV